MKPTINPKTLRSALLLVGFMLFLWGLMIWQYGWPGAIFIFIVSLACLGVFTFLAFTKNK